MRQPRHLLGKTAAELLLEEADDLEHADQLRIDLDPSPGVSFSMIQEAAEETHQLFEELSFVALPKTTGNRGIHVFAQLQPLWSSYEVRAAADGPARTVTPMCRSWPYRMAPI